MKDKKLSFEKWNGLTEKIDLQFAQLLRRISLATLYQTYPEIEDKMISSWGTEAITYFREIQYFFPDHIYTPKEITIIKNNRNNLVCHSKWLLQLGWLVR